MSRFNRRFVLKGAAAALAAPAVLRSRDALASSGSVNVFAWGDYVQDNQIKHFEDKTGIKVNLSTYGSNDEAQQKLKAAGGKGFDVIFPSVTNVVGYRDGDKFLLQEIDESKIHMDAIIPSMVRDSIALGAVQDGKRVALPFNWGTEAVTFDSSVHDLADADVSYGSLWSGKAKSASLRQRSGIMGVGLYLDATGEVPSNRMLDIYTSEAEARRVWDKIAEFIIRNKGDIGAFWNNATEATNAFAQQGCSIGQTWDTTGILLARQDAKWKYRMPKEGGLTWLDSVAIPVGAENLDQAYAFINACYEGEMAGLHVANTGYNSAAVEAAAHAGEEYAKTFAEIYSPETLANLWWWQADTPWITPLTQEYVDKITNA
ncbi:extracellular solute-binding protein [Neomegalonema sp.]|uniref:extracellular solute-binding protein n=1 Tax=Neomegalonema sp. TaxID=2039713 RepID=UPI00262F0F00|nr:extracellular solute-binding protein [Neomegalonema sp.]MDD2868203.1 extracellular solute-binding protein [Neomegalonema sp.]